MKRKLKKQINVLKAFNFWFFNVFVIKWKLYEIVYYVWMKFNFSAAIIISYKMFNLDDITNENNKKNNEK